METNTNDKVSKQNTLCATFYVKSCTVYLFVVNNDFINVFILDDPFSLLFLEWGGGSIVDHIQSALK